MTIGKRNVKEIRIRAKTRDIIFELEDRDAEVPDSNAAYYTFYKSRFSEEIKDIPDKYESWKEKKFFNGVSLEDLEELRVKELVRILDSGFILKDSANVNASKKEASWFELQELKIENRDRIVRYAILKELLPMSANGRFVFENKKAIGHYLKDNHHRLTDENVMDYFRFECVIKLIYKDIDSLYKEQMENTLSAVDRSVFDRLLGYVQKGDWQSPATYENVSMWISTLFGVDTHCLELDDLERTRLFRSFFREGSAGADTDRVEVSMADILGYLMRYHLLAGGPQKVSRDVFGNTNQVNNLNKGRNLEGNQKFKELVPLLDKYRKRIICT